MFVRLPRAHAPSHTRRVLRPGLYEQLVTTALDAILRDAPADRLRIERAPIDGADAHATLARHVATILARVLDAVGGQPTERLQRQVAIVNRLLEHLGTATQGESVAPSGDELLAIAESTAITSAITERPGIPLSASHLLVNAPKEHRIGHELQRELASADAVDLICAFVRWYGLRILEAPLRRLLDAGRRVRVLTTVYTGSTEAKALDALLDWGAAVKVSYDTQRTRLHAKAWMFHRATGFSTAYIGSSNLSSSALLDGLEWNVRLSQIETPHVLERFQAVFDAYWEDAEFEPYSAAARPRFQAAVQRATNDEPSPLSGLDIHPFPYQTAILDQLEAERTLHGRWRNLVVAATGTGKTIVAALDYRRVREGWRNASLLFVAHRKEILEQSRRVFREVLRDASFGELWVDGERPEDGRHVFASIQTLAQVDLDRLPRDFFDVVIVDEVHHAHAATYTRLLEHVVPRLLLGLTATPERADGRDVRTWFDGRIAAELRLWSALEQQILAPFQYFGLYDDVDLSDARWRRGGYEAADLEKVYVLSRELARRRVRLIIEALDHKVPDRAAMRALGFCVSVEHARFMAEQFVAAGIPAIAVTGDTDRATRSAALRQLRERTVNVVFTVDLFNEGVDVPEIDTILLLRPTESATVFLQQIGRGLRRAPGKTCCTIFDFIGQPHRFFRFDQRFRALLPGSRRDVERQVEDGFPVMPPGCAIDLDREASRVVLGSLRNGIGRGLSRLIEELRGWTGSDLRSFLEDTGVELTDLYRKAGNAWLGWTALRRRAGRLPTTDSEFEGTIAAGTARMLHIDDDERLKTYRRLLSGSAPDSGGVEPRQLAMLHYLLWGRDGRDISVDQGLDRLWSHPDLLAEARELLAILDDRTDHVTHPLHLPGGDVPLRVHASYTLNEVLAALGRIVPGTSYSQLQAGVLWDEPSRTDFFFVTTAKSERDYSPTTMYRDYAISPELFHWESQSATRAESATGRRYREHRDRGSAVVLFVRTRKRDDRGVASAYVCLGTADYVRHEGEQPMAITWRLHRPMPATFFAESRVAAA